MKLLTKKNIFVVLFCSCAIICNAQSVEPTQALYANKPEVISFAKNTLTSTFSSNVGNVVTINFANDFDFAGTVIHKELKQANFATMAVRSASNSKSILQIARIINADNTIKYTGQIINQEASDGYFIRSVNDAYSLQKYETSKILEPCNF